MSDIKQELLVFEGEEYAHVSLVNAQQQRIEQLEQLAKEAYIEGWLDNDEFSPKYNIAECWRDSHSKEALEQRKDE